MERKIKVLLAKERCSCNACFARNYQSALTPQIGAQVEHLYEVHIDHLVTVLCADCLAALKLEINKIMAEEPRPP